VVGPVVKALTPRVKEKILGADLDAELSEAVERAWEKAAGHLCETTEPPCDIADLDEIGRLVGRALNTEGTAAALVISLLDPSRPFDWSEHPEAGAILDGIDPATAPVDPRSLWDAFTAALHHDVVDAAGKRGLFEQAVVAGLEDLKGKNAAIEGFIRQLRSNESTSLEQIEREPGVATPSLHQLPPDVALFTGREAELSRLRALLPEGGTGTAISAIAGTAGVGKTSLALRLAHELVPRFGDVQLFVNLHGYDTRQRLTPGRVLDRFLRALGVAPEAIPTEVDEQAALYRSLLADRAGLVVLDNASSTEQVRLLLPGSPTCLVLLTSRRRLAALDGALFLDLDVMDPSEALDFLRKLAGPERVNAEPEAADRIVTLCGRLPLALRIAGSRLGARPAWSLAWLAGRLADERTRLGELEVEDLEVRTTFALSYRDLDAPAARMFRRLGLVAGPDFAPGVAAALTDSTPEEAEALLEGLVDAHLLEATLTSGRYRFHDLLRLYAQERLQADEEDQERDGALRQMLEWYVDTALAGSRLLTPTSRRRSTSTIPRVSSRDEAGMGPGSVFATRAAALDWFEAERANLVAATRQAASLGLDAIAWQLPKALFRFFYLRKHWSDWQNTHTVGLAIARAAHNRPAEASILTNLGIAYSDLRCFEEAIDCQQQAHAICRELGNRSGEAAALANLGVIYNRLGRPDEAIDCARQALPIFREFGDHRAEGRALENLGHASRMQQHFAEAIDYGYQALSIYREIGDPNYQGSALRGIGNAYLATGGIPEAIDCLNQALKIYRDDGLRWGEGAALQSLGLALQQIQRRDDARACWEEALIIFTQLGAPAADDIRALLDQ
jgi:tetratricopeptide (TPR) repeat protein